MKLQELCHRWRSLSDPCIPTLQSMVPESWRPFSLHLILMHNGKVFPCLKLQSFFWICHILNYHVTELQLCYKPFQKLLLQTCATVYVTGLTKLFQFKVHNTIVLQLCYNPSWATKLQWSCVTELSIKILSSSPMLQALIKFYHRVCYRIVLQNLVPVLRILYMLGNSITELCYTIVLQSWACYKTYTTMLLI